VHRVPVAAGDSILVRSGQVHAIDGGNLILEIQQNSDTTYRVYDWGRVGLDGKPPAAAHRRVPALDPLGRPAARGGRLGGAGHGGSTPLKRTASPRP
jgi:hypothetical protein